MLQDGDLEKFRVEVESFVEAYNPIPVAGEKVDGDQQLGVTFDHATHFDITAGKVAKGGASKELIVSE